MADNNLFYYRGYPLIRSGDTIFYGSGGDKFAAKLTIKDTKTVNDTEIPNNLLVQLTPRSMEDVAKGRKGEFTGLYESLDTAYVGLNEALFG